jgi:hypothetical protein
MKKTSIGSSKKSEEEEEREKSIEIDFKKRNHNSKKWLQWKQSRTIHKKFVLQEMKESRMHIL